MHQRKEDLPVALERGAIRAQAGAEGGMTLQYMQFPAGADMTEPLKGLPGNLCPVPHWGYVLEGAVPTRYADGREETTSAGEVYYWPSGHTVRFEEDTRFVEFSPAEEMGKVVAHLTAPQSAAPRG
jgi:hypothetical protein